MLVYKTQSDLLTFSVGGVCVARIKENNIYTHLGFFLVDGYTHTKA